MRLADVVRALPRRAHDLSRADVSESQRWRLLEAITRSATTGQVVVRLFQTEQVSDKVQPRTLRAGLYVGETLISNLVDLTFDQTSADKRDRYQSARMLLSQESGDYNNRAVEFRLEERIPNTNRWRLFAKAVYTLKRSFASDFDF